MNPTNHIQQKWKQNLLPGIDCILFGNGKVTIANTYEVKDLQANTTTRLWFALCDTTVESLEHYEPDIWTSVDRYNSVVFYGDEKIIFGEGSMGNDGFVASVDENNGLNWGIFFTFSNPIIKVVVENNQLICTSELDIKITIQLDDITKILVENV